MDSDVPADDLADLLFSYEAHHTHRQVAVIRGTENGPGVVVEWATSKARRTIAFPSHAQAKKFVDEALMALEYLGCTINGWWERDPQPATRASHTLRQPAATAV
jgi:hypothetical protein